MHVLMETGNWGHPYKLALVQNYSLCIREWGQCSSFMDGKENFEFTIVTILARSNVTLD